MRPAWLIALKDLRQRLRDRSVYIWGVIAPLGLVLIMNGAIGGAAEGGFGFSFAVADLDGGPVAAAFVDVLGGIEGFEVNRAASADEVEAAADAGDIAGGFVIPPGFSTAVTTSGSAGIQVIGNPDAQIGTQVARSIADGFVAELNGVRLSVGAAVAAGTDTDIATLVERAQAGAAPVVVSDARVEDRGWDFTTYYSVGMAIFFLFFTVQFGILSLVDERSSGTIGRLLGAPIPLWSIVVGKGLSSFVVGALSTLVLVGGTTVLLGAEWGDPVGIVILATAGILAAIGIVFLVATLVRTAEQAQSFAAIIAVTLGLLGGVFFPISLAPDLIDKLSFITPHRWLFEGFSDLNAGESFTAVLPEAGAILLFAVVFGGIGLNRTRRLVRLG
jgi:ABC-2 type transport system permease protein